MLGIIFNHLYTYYQSRSHIVSGSGRLTITPYSLKKSWPKINKSYA